MMNQALPMRFITWIIEILEYKKACLQSEIANSWGVFKLQIILPDSFLYLEFLIIKFKDTPIFSILGRSFISSAVRDLLVHTLTGLEVNK